jgi:hypothetical protein
MTDAANPAPVPWARKTPERIAPRRTAGGLYRAARGDYASTAFHGIPLQTASDTAVSAVRAAYRVVDAQMERGARIARSLREASERQGAGDPAQALDAGERLARKALLAGVEWLETLVAEPGNPVKRALAAEYRMVGAALGIVPTDSAASSKTEETPKNSATPNAAPGYPVAAPVGPTAKVRHVADTAFRAVSIVKLQMDEAIPPKGAKLRFYCASTSYPDPIDGTLLNGPHGPVMEIHTLAVHPAGRWKSSLCNERNIQFGIVEIEL